MPEIAENLDEQRFNRIRHDAILIANLWLSLVLAAERRDKVDAWTACGRIQALNKVVFPLVKELGTEKVDG